jgi:hypothetical protein
MKILAGLETGATGGAKKKAIELFAKQVMGLASKESTTIDTFIARVAKKFAGSEKAKLAPGVREYAKLIKAGVARVQELRRRIDLYQSGASFGFDGGGADQDILDEYVQALWSLDGVARIGSKVRWDTPGPEAPQKAPRSVVSLFCGGYVGTHGEYAWCRALTVETLACGRPGDQSEIDAAMHQCGNDVGGEPEQALRTCCARFSLCVKQIDGFGDLMTIDCD